ncbi:hypothetical protein STEG23_012669 [Scotinomys teguina]
MTSVRLFISLLSFDLVDLSIAWNLPSSAFCKAGFVDRLGLFMLSQISWTFSFMTFLDLVFSLTDESISSIGGFTAVELSISFVFIGVSDFFKLEFSFCRTGFVERLDLFMVSQIFWTFCVMIFSDLVFL